MASSTKPLNPKQQRFVSEYLVSLNASEAARKAGYSTKNADVVSARLLVDVGISAAIAQGASRQLKSADLSAKRTLEEIRRVGFHDIRELFDARGNLKPIHTLTAEQAAAISGIEVIIKNAEAGDGHTDTVHKVKVWDKMKALEMAAKHFALLTDVVRTEDATAVRDRLKRGRDYARAK